MAYYVRVDGEIVLIATRKSDVDSVRFLVQQEGILLDTLSKSSVEAEDEDDQLYETPLNCAVRFVEDNDDDAEK